MRNKIKRWWRNRRLTKNEKKLMRIGLQVVEEYVNSRSFRRKIRNTLSESTLVDILGNWDDKN